MRRSQRGVVMIVALIALVLLLVGGAAMLRTIDTSSILVGNLSFRRDLANRAERGFVLARAALSSGALSVDSVRTADVTAANYSASKLTDGAGGIPLILTKDSAFTMTGADITEDEVTVRYVIDRRCVAAGTFDAGSCESLTSSGDAGGSNWLKKPSGSSRPLYRISVRVKGPQNTEAYFQTTYAR
jgi:Tfp pilus assembly protein PilX